MRTSLLVVAFLLSPVAALAEEEFLPTPYTADEIRDAWVAGFEVLTRTRAAAGVVYSLTRVVQSSDEGFTMVEVEATESGRAKEGADPTRYSGTWDELRDHARFPTSRATRQRTERDTPLGRLEGWLYLVEGDDGVTEFFFADGLAGPPVVYRRQGAGPSDFVSEQMSRSVRPE